MFERLTNRNESGIAYAKIPTNPSNMIDVGECYTGRIIDRLAAYEDTGLTPERIRAYVAELQNAFNILFESERQKQQENEQLRAQVARVRAALTIANNYMPDIGQFCVCGKCKGCGTDIGYSGYEYCLKCARVIIDEALSDTPADYHNPADVEALIMAMEAIKAAWSDGSANAAMDKASDALAAIDKTVFLAREEAEKVMEVGE